MKRIKMDKKTLKRMAIMAGEVFTVDPVHKYASAFPGIRKRFIYHFMTERLSASNGKDIIYLDEEKRGMCIWRDAKDDYTVLDFLKCPHWIFLLIYWVPTLRALFVYSKRDLSVFPDNTLLIEPVFVGKDFQGKGIASSLIKQGISDLVPLGYNLGLETQNPDNVNLYKKLGFEIISEQTLIKDKIFNYSMIYKAKE